MLRPAELARHDNASILTEPGHSHRTTFDNPKHFGCCFIARCHHGHQWAFISSLRTPPTIACFCRVKSSHFPKRPTRARSDSVLTILILCSIDVPTIPPTAHSFGKSSGRRFAFVSIGKSSHRSSTLALRTCRRLHHRRRRGQRPCGLGERVQLKSAQGASHASK